MLSEIESLNLRLIPEKLLSKISIPVITATGDPRLSDQVIELFSLGENEVEQINYALAEASDRLTEFEIENLGISEKFDNGTHKVQIQIPSLGELADEVENGLRNNMINALGPTDGLLLHDLLKHSNWSYFNDYGRNEFTYGFQTTPTEDGKMKLVVEHTRTDPETGRQNSRGSETTKVDPDHGTLTISGHRQSYIVDLLPESINRYFRQSRDKNEDKLRPVHRAANLLPANKIEKSSFCLDASRSRRFRWHLSFFRIKGNPPHLSHFYLTQT